MSYREKLASWIKNEMKNNGLVQMHISLNKDSNVEDISKSVLCALDKESRGKYTVLTYSR